MTETPRIVRLWNTDTGKSTGSTATPTSAGLLRLLARGKGTGLPQWNGEIVTKIHKTLIKRNFSGGVIRLAFSASKAVYLQRNIAYDTAIARTAYGN